MKCIQKDVGEDLVFQYAAEDIPEKPILTSEDRHLFEVHLQSCDYCQQQLILLADGVEKNSEVN